MLKEVFEFVAKSNTRDISKIRSEIDGAAGSMDEYTGAASRSEGASRKAEGGMSRLGRAAGALKKALAVGAIAGLGALATVGGVVTRDLMAMSSAMNTFQAQTGVSLEELSAYEGIAQNLFKQGWGDSFEQVVQTMSQVRTMTGASGDELELLTQNALIFGQAFDRDVTETVRAVDTAMEAFGEDGQRVFDLLTAGMQQTGDPGQDLLDTFNEYSNNFAEMGFTAEQMLSLLNQGLKAGARNTDDIADGMREFQIRLKDGTSDLALWQLGLDGQNMAFKRGEINAASMFESITGALSDIEDPIRRNALGVEIFGTKWEDAGEAAFLALDPTSRAIWDVEGATQEAGDALSRGLGPAWQRFTRTVRVGLVNAIGPLIAAFLNKLTPGLERLGGWINRVGIPVLAVLFGMLADGAGDVLNLGESIIDGLLGAFSQVNPQALQPLAVVFESLVNALKAIAIGDLDAIRTAFSDLFSNIAGALAFVSIEGIEALFSALEDLTGIKPTAIAAVAAALLAFKLPGIISGLGGVATNVAALGKALVGAMGSIALPLVVIGGLFLAVQNNTLGLRDNLENLVNKIRDGDVLGALGEFGEAMLKLPIAIPLELARNLGDLIGVDMSGLDAWAGIWDNFKIMVGYAKNEVVNFFTRTKAKIEEFAGSVKAKFEEGAAAITGFGDDVREKLAGVGQSIIDGITSGLNIAGAAASWMLSIATQMGLQVLSAGTLAGAVLLGVGTSILNRIKDGWADLATWLSANIVTPMADKLIELIGGPEAALKLLTVGSLLLTGIKNGFGNIAQWVWDNVISPILGAITGLPSAVTDAIKAAVSGNIFGSDAGEGDVRPDTISGAPVGVENEDGSWTLVDPSSGMEVDPRTGLPIPRQRARGGLTRGWTIMGEEGPELANIGSTSRVFSHQDSKDLLLPALRTAMAGAGAGGGSSMMSFSGATFNFYGVQNVQQLKRELEQLEAQQNERVMRARIRRDR